MKTKGKKDNGFGRSILLSMFMKDAIFWDVDRCKCVEVSIETVVEIVYTEERGNHKPFPEF
jgi:hypothetical protein